ncbi:MAG: hypothetical protein ACK4LB_04695 [Spirosomataceae bacterium]
MGQLSLVDEFPNFTKHVFLDVFVESTWDPKRGKLVLKTLGNQFCPGGVRVGCPVRYYQQFPVGTIYKIDMRRVHVRRQAPYFLVIRRKHMQRAIEFFEHNRRLLASAMLSS